ncbi:hypothetical protein [Micromonospora sp. WMMD1082]|uniref:hypothetical protein n=1 Tax=Micromonospora sp. WMMD1082 TaxID=3016104 RepID=UPI0024166286|nr:hypothetical protein [Micromonospora sp. WMMD1082]MDG4794367.1 hypothetical protein [Micromonospora sp. WMMD1082]
MDGIPATVRREAGSADWQVSGAHRRRHVTSRRQKASAAMGFLFFLLFFLLLALLSAVGLTADSRDSADWKPSDGGRRRRSHPC